MKSITRELAPAGSCNGRSHGRSLRFASTCVMTTLGRTKLGLVVIGLCNTNPPLDPNHIEPSGIAATASVSRSSQIKPSRRVKRCQ